MSLDSSPSSPARRRPEVPPGAWAAGVVAAALAASYAPSLTVLARTWWDEPNYSHGFLVAPIAALILWQRRDRLAQVAVRPSVFGWIGLLAILAFRAYLYERNEMWMESA